MEMLMTDPGSQISTNDTRQRGDANDPNDEKPMRYEVAVLIPCHNEEATIGKVVRDFRAVLPSASVYVYDNCSTDGTVEVARAAGAIVRREDRKGIDALDHLRIGQPR